MYGFWRLGLRPAPSVGATCVANGLETATSMNAKKLATRASTGTTHATRSAAVRRREGDRQRGQAGQDEQPEQQRALLAAPEGGDRVRASAAAARVLGDVREREVVPEERREQHDRRDDGRREGREERVLSRPGEPPLAGRGRVAAGDERVERKAEAEHERRAPELGH